MKTETIMPQNSYAITNMQGLTCQLGVRMLANACERETRYPTVENADACDIQREDIQGKVKKVLETRKVRGLKGRLVTKAFVQLEGGYTMWVPSAWVE